MRRTFTAEEKASVFELWKNGTGFSEIANILGSKPGTIFTMFKGYWRHNLNLRQHLARLGRKSLSFSKSVELHDKVIGHYLNIKHYQ